MEKEKFVVKVKKNYGETSVVSARLSMKLSFASTKSSTTVSVLSAKSLYVSEHPAIDTKHTEQRSKNINFRICSPPMGCCTIRCNTAEPLRVIPHILLPPMLQHLG